MTIRKFAVFLLLVALAATWYQKSRLRTSERSRQQNVISSLSFKDEPEQTDTNESSFEFKNFSIKPLARFVIRARVLSKEEYSSDVESKLSPLDLALGWKRMADPAIYESLHITQGGRWYHYSWSHEPPIPPQEIIESSANMHMIPSDQSVERILEQAKTGKFVKIKGMLVEISNGDGWKWRSSLSRSDTGNGSCEVLFVEAAEVE